MGAASKVGREVAKNRASRGFFAAMAIPAGVAAAVHSERPVQGMVNNALDMAYYDPALEDQGFKGRDVDNHVLGRDVRFGEMFPNPISSMAARAHPLRKFKDALTSENFQNLSSSKKMSTKVTSATHNAYDSQMSQLEQVGSGNDQYWDDRFGIPYRPSVTKGPVYSSGDMVFGMYNKRSR